jgi:hypothetical protein
MSGVPAASAVSALSQTEPMAKPRRSEVTVRADRTPERRGREMRRLQDLLSRRAKKEENAASRGSSASALEKRYSRGEYLRVNEGEGG